jgi:hypothetical protein
MVGGEIEVRMERRTVDAGAERLGQGDDFRQRPAARHLVADDQRQSVGRSLGQQPGQLSEPAGHRGAVDRRPGRDLELARLVEHVHRDRHEHRSGGRRGRGQEGPTEDGRQLAEVADLVLPLRRPGRQPGEVTGQDRLGQEVATVLLAGGHHHRRVVGPSVGEIAEPTAEAGHRMEVHEARPATGLGVPIGHGHGDVLLEAEHVVQLGVLGQRVHERQLGRARVPEAVRHTL